MKLLSTLLLMFVLLLAGQACAGVSAEPYAISFSQEVLALAPDGTPYTPVPIIPERMQGVRSHRFDLGRGRDLVIETNISDADERGLLEVAGTIARCYNYVEQTTGRALEKGMLLYLLEFDTVPFSYTFEASFADENLWGEVRLAMVRKGESLTGPYASAGLAELLYDTLPHELGHDVLAEVDTLLHDVEGKPSHHTRWFIEGVCEVLAKGFARQEVPGLLRHFLEMRKVGSVFDDPRMSRHVFLWAQENGNGMEMESDLYGAAMLVMMSWTRHVPIAEVLDRIEHRSVPVDGFDLMAMMERMAGCDSSTMCEVADRTGKMIGVEYRQGRLPAPHWGS